jgi:glycogen debranching enzyme/CRP-like cAMP-binding protein
MEKVERALRKVPLLSGLNDFELGSLAGDVEVRHYRTGDVIVRQGEAGASIYIVLQGRVNVVYRAKPRADGTRLNELGPGDFFGEIALLEDVPRSADVVAATPTTCAVLSREVFHRRLLASPEVAAGLLAALSRRVRALSELVEQPRFESRASPRERERRILELGEAAMASDIRNALVIKEQNHFTLFDPEGNIPIANTAGFGLYLGDTRHLSGYEISLGRVQAVSLLSTARLGYASDQQLTNRDLKQRGSTIRKETLLISREHLAHDAGFDGRITVSNFNPFPVDITIQIRFAADFADIFEVRGGGRSQRGHRLPAKVGSDAVVLGYEGLDDRTYETRLSFSPPATRLRAGSAQHRTRVEPLGRSSFDISVVASVNGQGNDGRDSHAAQTLTPAARLAEAKSSYQEWLEAATALDSDNALFNAAIERSLLDLRLLVNRLDDQWLFGAGIPWYATLFGRDSLITGFEMLAWNPELAAGILRLLARYQGSRRDDWRDEEPGKILHELRTGELARTNRVPHTPYYGTIDATPLFVMLAASYYDWTGDLALIREIEPSLEAALRWCLESGDIDGDSYVEYARRSPKGLANQGWKDSGDGIVFADGRLPIAPIALVEVQGYVYAAYRAMARLRRALDPDDATGDREFVMRAARLKERFNQDFWMPDSRFYALGLDGNKRQIDALSSNPGHALWAGIVDEPRAPLVAERLLSEGLFSGWGIRTLSDSSVTYNPLGYHLGTIWPHDNALIVAGLRRYGQDEAANRVFTAMFESAQFFPYFRLPELFSGIPRSDYSVPIAYPVACSPQAWAAAALPCMLSHVLGLRPRDGGKTLEIVRPYLPTWLTGVNLRSLRVGQARLDLTFTRSDRAGESAQVTVNSGRGDVDVRVYA